MDNAEGVSPEQGKMWAMGDRDVDRIIEQWRAQARAAGESAPAAAAQGRLRLLLRRIGWLRLMAAAAAVAVFAVVAVPVLTAPDRRAAAPAPASPSAAPVDDAPPTQAPAPSAAPDWFAIMQGVDTARATAYGSADDAALTAAFATDGAALGRERAAVSALAAGGVRAVGWRTEILSVRVVDLGAEAARLGVSDLRGTYDLVDAQGTTTTVPAAKRADWLVDLRKQGDGWVVVEVVAAEPATSPPAPP